MNGTGPQLVLVLVLVAINASLTGTELALVSLRESQVKRLEESGGRRGRTLAQLTRDPNQFLATIQIGITLAGFLASATAAVSLAELLEGPLGFLGDAARPVSIVVVTLILAYFTLVFGELAPEAPGHAEHRALGAARRPPAGRDVHAHPARSSGCCPTRPTWWSAWWGATPTPGAEEMSAEEVRGIIAEHATFSPDQRQIIEGALEAAERTLRQVLRPRADVVAVDGAMTCQEAALLLAEAGHSRAPVTAAGQDLDGVIGTVHVRDLVARPDDPVAVHTRPALFLPESVQVLDALRRMQADRQQLCLVVNEHGGTEGLVSRRGPRGGAGRRDLRRVRPGHPHRAPAARAGPSSSPGGSPSTTSRTSASTIPEGEYTTVAGAVLDRTGPHPRGARVSGSTWATGRPQVLTVEGHAITAVRLSPRRAAPG